MNRREWAARRRRLMKQMGPGSLALLPAAPMQLRSRDVHHPFRQDSDFNYLLGFDEPRAMLVLAPGHSDGASFLFCQPRDPQMERWEGRRAGPAKARQQCGVDQAFAIDELENFLPVLMEGRHTIYYPFGREPELDHQVLAMVGKARVANRLSNAPHTLADLGKLIHLQRLVKSVAEQRVIQQSVDIAVSAHLRAMRNCQPGMMEYQLEAEVVHEFLHRGARAPAYPSIVGSGPRACTLHYTANEAKLKNGEMVLLDAGCEYQGYASDITRTFPVNGRFSPEQRSLYQVVLAAQRAALEQVRPGNPWDAPQRASELAIAEGLGKLDLLGATPPDQWWAAKGWRRYYMHRVGHWLGMDVHDVGAYQLEGDWRCLEPGMVLTIEPGVYIDSGERRVPPCWRGLGIRIEDDVLVTRQGCQVLSAGLIQEPDEIEAWMAGEDPS